MAGEESVDFAGRWIGRFFGTNTGNFVVDLQHVGGEVVGQARLNEVNVGLAVFNCVGIADGPRIALVLDPSVQPANAVYTRVQLIGSIGGDGVLSGTWDSEAGTAGGFSCVREERLAQASVPVPAAATTALWYEKQARVPSCVVELETFRRIYRDLSSAADQAAQLEHARRQREQPAGEGAPDYATIRQRYAVTVLARGESGEQVLTLDASVLRADRLPRPLRSIEFEIGWNYRLLTRGTEAPNRAKLVLDFSKPRAFDFTNPSTNPNPNLSSITVQGNDSFWVSGIFEKLNSSVREGRLRTGWLHAAHTYDVLLFLLGFPLVFMFAATLTGRVFASIGAVEWWYQFVFLLYGILIALVVFRLGFSVARWLLPYIELAPPPQPIHRQLRIVFATLMLGAAASLAASLVLELVRATSP